MYFSDIVAQIGSGEFNFEYNQDSIFKIKMKPLTIEFNSTGAILASKEQSYKINLTDFSKVSFEEADEEKVDIYFDEKKLATISKNDVDSFEENFAALVKLFNNDVECSPKFQVENLIKEYGLSQTAEYNANLYKLLIKYKERMDYLHSEGLLHPESKILCVLEAESGKILSKDNLQSSTKKIGGAILKSVLTQNPKSIGKLAVNLASSAGTRIFNQKVGEIVDSKGLSLLILTDKNVILALNNGNKEYDFKEANKIFSAKDDPLMAGIADVYRSDDSKTPILENVPKADWKFFDSSLKELKKENSSFAFFKKK